MIISGFGPLFYINRIINLYKKSIFHFSYELGWKLGILITVKGQDIFSVFLFKAVKYFR